MTTKTSMCSCWRALYVVPLALTCTLAAAPGRAQDAAPPAQAQSQTQNQQSFSQAQIQQLVAPIALYPDALLTQVLMASTYPLEVVEAARWSHDNPAVSGQSLENAMQSQSWDPSVKALTAVPQALAMMNDKIDWTEQLGDAFLAQQQDLLAAVQKLRAEAQAAGNLQSTPQQVVTTAPAPAGAVASSAQPPIVIEAANPDVYYVPVYNPAIVYGAWQYPAYQPFYWSPPGFVASNVVSFAAGVAVGAAIWGGCNWWNNNVFINVNSYNIFNHADINNNNWIHDPAHRGDVPYYNAALAARFGRTNEVSAREALRDRVDSGHDDMFKSMEDARGNASHRFEGDAQQAGLDKNRIDAPHADPVRRNDGDADEGFRRSVPDGVNRLDADPRREGGEREMDRMMPPRDGRLGEGGDFMGRERMPSFRSAREGFGHMDFRRR